MTKPADLSPVMRKAYDALSEQDREAFLEQLDAQHASRMSGAAMQVMMRNLSHHVGKHVVKALA